MEELSWGFKVYIYNTDAIYVDIPAPCGVQ